MTHDPISNPQNQTATAHSTAAEVTIKPQNALFQSLGTKALMSKPLKAQDFQNNLNKRFKYRVVT